MTGPNQLLTVTDRVMLLVNALNAGDPYPVCRFCTPDGLASWIAVSVDPEDLDRLFGLCNSSEGKPVVEYFKLAEISRGASLVRDDQFVPDRPFSQYVHDES